MPDEYISREAAIEEIDKWLDTVGTVLVGKGLSYYGELIGCIEDTPAADVAPVVHGQWISTKDRLPDNGGNYGWAHCIVSVFESISSPFTEDVNEREFVSTALFDVEQKIWHVGRDDELVLNAMLDIEDSPSNGCFVSHWMPLPEEPADVYEVAPKNDGKERK